MITLEDVEAAARRIASRIRRTPVLEVEAAAFGVRSPVFLKLKTLQYTDSFKPRGVFNRILTSEEANSIPDAGVICASGDNANLAVAYAARELGIRTSIFVPEAASPVKVQRLRALGAEVVVTGEFYADAHKACLQQANQNGGLVGGSRLQLGNEPKWLQSSLNRFRHCITRWTLALLLT